MSGMADDSDPPSQENIRERIRPTEKAFHDTARRNAARKDQQFIRARQSFEKVTGSSPSGRCYSVSPSNQAYIISLPHIKYLCPSKGLLRLRNQLVSRTLLGP